VKKNILIIYAKSSAEIYNRQSALGSYIYCLASVLEKGGYAVTINDIDFADIGGQQTSSGNSSGGYSLVSKLIPSFLKSIIKDIRLFKWIDNLYTAISKNQKFDSVIEFYTYGSNLGYRISKENNIPLILIYDNPVLEEHVFFYGEKIFFKGKIENREKESILSAKSIVAYSKAVEDYLNKKYGKKLPIFIHQNVDYSRFDFIETKKVNPTINIGFIGSFLKWHSVDLLIKAFEILRQEGKDVKLFLLGNGMEFNSIYEQVKNSKFANDIVIPGFVDGDELYNYKKQLDIGVMPGSNWYGAPNKIFEYGAAKMAVVAPDTPTIKSLFRDGEEVLLFQMNNCNDLYEKLKFYVDNEALRNLQAQALQQKIRNNYSENITFTFYNQLLKNY
jgi:glycosyltransferase involved in cell wall biosynthesis